MCVCARAYALGACYFTQTPGVGGGWTMTGMLRRPRNKHRERADTSGDDDSSSQLCRRRVGGRGKRNLEDSIRPRVGDV